MENNEKNKLVEEEFFKIQDFIKENIDEKLGRIVIVFDPEQIDDFQPKIYGNMNVDILQDFLLLSDLWIRNELRKQETTSEGATNDETN